MKFNETRQAISDGDTMFMKLTSILFILNNCVLTELLIKWNLARCPVLLPCIQPPFRKAIKSERSLDEGIPAKAMAFPGANPEGEVSHLSRLVSDHLRVALEARAPEYWKFSPEAMLLPKVAPRAGPTELAESEWQAEHRFLKTFSPATGFPEDFFFFAPIISF